MHRSQALGCRLTANLGPRAMGQAAGVVLAWILVSTLPGKECPLCVCAVGVRVGK